MNPEEELNPITGLPPKKPRINKITGLPVDPNKESLPFTGDPMAYGFTRDMSDYTSRGIRVTPYQNIDEQRAEEQGTLETWGRGIARAGTTFGTTLGTTVIGGIEGIARVEDELIRNGWDEVNFADAFVTNNQSAQYFTNVANKVREDLPIFKTAEEDSRQGTLQDIFSAHYLAGDFLDGMAYVGAAMASAALTGGAGLGSLTISGVKGGLNLAARVPGVKAAMAATKATRAFQAGASAATASTKYMTATYSALAATRAARAVRAVPGFGAASKYVSTVAPRKQMLAKAIDTSFFLSTTEAAVEALDVKEQSKQKLLEQALIKYKVEREEDLPIQVRQNIEIASNNLAGVGYAANLPMLMLTNSIFFSLLKPVQGARIGGITFKGGKAIYNPGSIAKRATKVIGLDAASEAVQEGYQWGIQQQLINNELNKYNDMGSVATFHELMKDRENYFADAINKTPDLFNQLLKAPFDPEGRSAMITGALVGGITSAMRLGVTKPFAEEDARGKMAETLLNSEYFSDLREKAARSNRVATHLKNKEFFEKQGDTEAAERELAAAFQEEAIFHVKNGTWEAFLKRIELEAEKPLDQFKEDYQIKDNNFTEEDRQKIVDRLADNLSDLAMFHTNLEFVFPGTKMPTGLKKKFYSKEKLAEIENKRKEESIYKNAILRSHFTIKTINTQLDKVFEDLNSKIPGIAEKLQELKDVKRNLFGELLSKKELQDTDMFEKIRLTNKELVEKFVEVDNLISDPVQKLIFDQYKENIYDLMQERDTYELAKTNLTRSPEKRDLFLSRMKLAEENKIYEEREKIIQSAIDEAQTSKDLSDRKQGFKNELDEHPSLKTRLEDEITKKLAEENEIDKRFHSMTKSEVQALDPSKLSPQEAYVRTLHLAKRTEEKAKPTEKKESKKPTKETTEPKEKEKEKEKTKKATTTRAANIKRDQGKKVADKALKLISLRNTNRHTDAAGVSRGQFEITQISVNNKAVDAVVVDSNGNPTPGLATRTLNGTPIIDFQLLGSPQVAKNDQVELKVIRDDWWVNSALAKEDEELHYKNIPIYIVHNGTPIGILQSGDHAARQAAFEADKTGGKVTTTISDKNRGYIFTGVETSPNGASVERHFYSLKESDNSANTPENIIAIVNTSGVKTTLDLSAEANEQIALSIQTELSTGNLTYGQVVRIETAPTGKLVPLPVQTATLNEDAQQAAIRLILEGKVLEFQTLVGTNSLINPTENPKSKFPLWIEYVGDKTFFIFKPKFVSKSVEISRELTNLIEENDDNVFVRIELEDLQHMLQNNGFDDREITAETIMNFLVKLEEEVDSETGDVRYMYNSYFERPLSSTEYFMIAKEVPSFGAEIFTDQLTVKRYNVDIDTLSSPETKFTSPVTGNSYKSYYEYLTSENEQAAVRNGSSAILATSYKNINTNPDGTGGSVFYDVELTLSPEFEVDGVKQDIDNQILRTAPETFEEETEAEETQAPETKTETAVNLDALFNPESTQPTPATTEKPVVQTFVDAKGRESVVTATTSTKEVEGVTVTDVSYEQLREGRNVAFGGKQLSKDELISQYDFTEESLEILESLDGSATVLKESSGGGRFFPTVTVRYKGETFTLALNSSSVQPITATSALESTQPTQLTRPEEAQKGQVASTEETAKIEKELEELREELKLAEELLKTIEENELEEKIDDAIESEVTAEVAEQLQEELGVNTEEEVKEAVKKAVKEDLLKNGISNIRDKASSLLDKVVQNIKKIIVGVLLAGTIFSGYSFTSNYSIEDVESFVTRGLVKTGLYTPQEETLELKEESSVPIINYDQAYENSITKFEKLNQGSDGIWSYRNQWLNKNGFEYIAGANNQNLKENGNVVYKGVEGVAHHLIMLSEAGDLTEFTSDSDLRSISDEVLKGAKAKNDYVPVITRLPEGRVQMTYKRASEVNSQTEFTPIRLRQTLVSDLDFDKKSSAEGFKNTIGAVTQKSTGEGFNSLVYVTKDSYGKFSGGAVVLLFNDKLGNLIVREYSGSINGIVREISNVKTEFGVSDNDITLGVYDAGSYTGKVGAIDNEVNPERYRGYNPSDKAGSSLMIPQQKSKLPFETDPVSSSLFLLGLLKRARAKEKISDEEIEQIKSKIQDLKSSIETLEKRLNTLTQSQTVLEQGATTSKRRRRASIDLQEEQNEDGERLRNECNSDFDDSPF
jgi:hypothetical protein